MPVDAEVEASLDSTERACLKNESSSETLFLSFGELFLMECCYVLGANLTLKMAKGH